MALKRENFNSRKNEEIAAVVVDKQMLTDLTEVFSEARPKDANPKDILNATSYRLNDYSTTDLDDVLSFERDIEVLSIFAIQPNAQVHFMRDSSALSWDDSDTETKRAMVRIKAILDTATKAHPVKRSLLSQVPRTLLAVQLLFFGAAVYSGIFLEPTLKAYGQSPPELLGLVFEFGFLYLAALVAWLWPRPAAKPSRSSVMKSSVPEKRQSFLRRNIAEISLAIAVLGVLVTTYQTLTD